LSRLWSNDVQADASQLWLSLVSCILRFGSLVITCLHIKCMLITFVTQLASN